MDNERRQSKSLSTFIERSNADRRAAYGHCVRDIKEHYRIEQTALAGGYGYRQVMELVQNAADAILEAHEEQGAPDDASRICVLLDEKLLYVANTGAQLSLQGVEALLSSHSSPKRGNQIGRFGLGFKSLLRLGGQIDIFTRNSGAIRFDPARCREELRLMFGVDEAPGLRLAWPLDDEERRSDARMKDFDWAETIVRVEIPAAGLHQHLSDEISDFPAQFLLFFPVKSSVALDNGKGFLRTLSIEPHDRDKLLHDGSETSRWRVVRREIHVTDERAIADATDIHARTWVPIEWAIPLGQQREEAGRFWAFFPTNTPTYIPGILNAPWKLNSDRNALIRGEWNVSVRPTPS